MNQQKEIIAAIAKHLGITPGDIDPSASLIEDLGLGPLEKADLLSTLSLEFNITFDPVEIENIITVNDLIEMIEDLLIE